MPFSSGLNPNIVKTALDDVFFAEFNIDGQPQLAPATDNSVFKQQTVDRAAVIEEIFKGSGLWEEKEEEQDVPLGNARVGDQITFTVIEYAKGEDITKNMFDDNLHNTVNRMIADFAQTGRVTRDTKAYALYRNAFTTTLTADGSALISDSHTNLNGDTVDNKITAALSTTSLEDAMVKMGEQLAQDGTIRGHQPASLLVPFKLFKNAVEITDSELISDSANNAINWVSSKYGITVKASPYLGAAAGGSDTAWFLLGQNHSIMRWVRQPVQTTLVNWIYQRNNNYIYKASFREVVGAITYDAIIGSTGAGA